MTGLGKTGDVFHNAVDIRLLHDDTSHTTFCQTSLHIVETGGAIMDRQHVKFDTLMQSVGLQHLEGERVHAT